MEFDQSLLDQWVSTNLELLFQTCSNATEKRPITPVQTLIELSISRISPKLTSQAQMQKLL